MLKYRKIAALILGCFLCALVLPAATYVAPSLKTINNHTYPLVKEQMLVVKQTPAAVEVQKFITFLGSSEGTKLLESNGIDVVNH